MLKLIRVVPNIFINNRKRIWNIVQVNNAGIGGAAIDEKGFLAQVSKNVGVSLFEYYIKSVISVYILL